ncbi:SRPBCC family protein [Amorphus sp. 3PC139-8]|uniref:SRPBCC family protein n=1 Tax=Amorphus sp. 3PC139-8 TaxID=2735676 RepID=UPI00345DD2BB
MTDDTYQLTLTRVFDAPRDKVWRCWTEPKLLEQWFCPKPWRVSDVVLDLKPGGAFSTVMHGPNGERFPTSGVFLEFVPNERLVTTDAFRPGWQPSGRAFMTSEVTFEDMGDGRTRYVAYARHWSEDAKKEHEQMGFHEGWGKAADQLGDLAKSI